MRPDRLAMGALLAALALAPPASAQPEGDGHAHAADQDDGMRVPKSGAAEVATLPSGTIQAAILDGDDKPLANVEVALGILENTVAKGESRKREVATTGPDGMVRWDKLQTGSAFSYRLTVLRDGGTFALAPFPLGVDRGMGARLYVFPVVHAIEQAVILSQAVTFIEIKDDRVQIEQAFTLANFGKNAWVPEDVRLQVPPAFRAFTPEPGQSDVGIDKLDGRDELKIHGTFSPGQHEIVFRWQLPYGGEREIHIEAEAPPHMAAARVFAAAAQKMKLDVAGMGEGKMDESRGQRLLRLDWEQTSAKSALKKLDIHLRDIPESGLPSWLMRSGMSLAALVALSAVVVVRSGKKRSDARAKKDQRALWLEELAELERAHASGEIGPKTYERARRELIDQIALTLEPARA